MTKFRVLIACLVVAFAFAMVPSESNANDFFGRATWNVPGFGVGGNLYGLGFVPTPPYYAIHPPVYYGQRYFRTYGESPYARPARSMRPLNIRLEIVKNPFYAPVMASEPELLPEVELETAEPKDQVAGVIINPYYQPAGVAQK